MEFHIRATYLGIDLGTKNTQVYQKEKGIIIFEPTLMLTSLESKGKKQQVEIMAIGNDAADYIGRVNPLQSLRSPLKEGRIDDLDLTIEILKHFIRSAIGPNNLMKPFVAISIPAGLGDVERKAMSEAVRLAGARQVYLVEKPLAAALGAGLDVYAPVGNMVVDIGGGTTEVAVVSLGGLVVSQSIPVGGMKMDEAIMQHIEREFSMRIGEQTAEAIKIDRASALLPTVNSDVRVRGQDLLAPQAMEITYSASQAHKAVSKCCADILSSIKWVLERTPPELLGDIMRNGIYMTGRGSQLKDLDRYIADALGLPVRVAENPADCTVLGLGYILENMTLLQDRGYMPLHG